MHAGNTLQNVTGEPVMLKHLEYCFKCTTVLVLTNYNLAAYCIGQRA